MTTPTTPWYRVPEAWLAIFLLASGVFAGVGLAVLASSLPDAHLPNGAQVRLPGH